ncbi:MAG: alpha/beta fold hydrolase [Deltaproteobacteria bacterium]|nr:alpha/beta fold hydrolase [Deltaproteobacteria bacterium]
MHFQKIEFRNAKGEKLVGRIDLPAGEKPKSFAVFAHCFTCTKDLNAVLHIDRALTREGIAVLRFDFTGLGESEGEFYNTGFVSNVEDLVAAADFLASRFEAPRLLIGHSLGGAAVLQAAPQIASCRAVATIGAPADLTHFVSRLSESEALGEQGGVLGMTLGERALSFRRKFVEGFGGERMESVIGHLGRALLVLHSPADEVVGIEHASRIFEAARHPKSFVSLDHADHLLRKREDSQYAGLVLAAWASRYVGLHPTSQETVGVPDKWVVARTGKLGYRTEIQAGRHTLMADEPIPLGGADTGPNPYDLLLAALGACTTMTLRMYADRKEWPLEAAVARLWHEKIYAEDCRECETKSGKIDAIHREIEIVGPLDEGQKKRLFEIADRCPVHKTLHSEIRVTSSLKE